MWVRDTRVSDRLKVPGFPLAEAMGWRNPPGTTERKFLGTAPLSVSITQSCATGTCLGRAREASRAIALQWLTAIPTKNRHVIRTLTSSLLQLLFGHSAKNL